MGKYKNLTILHSNDMHGDFLSENIDEKLIGGVSMLSGYVNKVRKECPNTLYCIAGDMFRGSVIDSEFKGISTIEIMNTIAPDIVTLGNHETDYGFTHLLFLEKCAKFPIINANIYLKTNHARLFNSHKIIEVDGMKILFIGIITENVMKQAKNEGVIGSFIDVLEASKEVGRICNAYNAIDIDLTILLTHIGFEEDKILAQNLDPAWGVDMIIGGHSHTFIEKPEIVNNILISQAGTGTDVIGRYDLLIDVENNRLFDYKWSCVAINDDNCPRDEAIDRMIASYKSITDKIYLRQICRLKRQLSHPDRYRETELGNLITDILKEYLAVDIVLLASGSIRLESLGPLILYEDLMECYPYDEELYMIRVSGKQLKTMFKYVFRPEVWQGQHSGFFQISNGLKIVFDINKDELISLTYNDEPIDDNKLYKLAMQKYQCNSFIKYFGIPLEEVLKNGALRVIATSPREIIEEYLMNHNNLDKTIDGRITIIK